MENGKWKMANGEWRRLWDLNRARNVLEHRFLCTGEADLHNGVIESRLRFNSVQKFDEETIVGSRGNRFRDEREPIRNEIGGKKGKRKKK